MPERRDEEHREDDGPQGSWWYVVPTIINENGERVPDLPENVTDWCAWYGTLNNEELAVVRTVNRLDVSKGRPTRSVNRVLKAAGYNSHPRGRVRGL